jgi:penicillin-binding protein 1C
MKRHFQRIPREFILGGLTIGFLVAGSLFVWAATLKIPDVSSLSERKVVQSTRMYDRTGEVLLYDLHENIDRTVVPIEEMSRNIQNATVAIEDAEFYSHIGVRPLATLRAVILQPLRGKGIQGGSTITQQVVKNSILTNDRTISRKLKEWVIALRLEQQLTKEQILELYLNESPYGGTIYGVEEASRAFFGKTAREVTLAEAAYLAALPQAPTYFSPYGNHREDLEDRKNLVLSRMRTLDFITEDEYLAAKEEVVEFQPQSISGIRAAHFVFYVREKLEAEFGKRTLEESGWRIITTIDMDLQEKAEEVVQRYALENETKFHAENAALVSMDPKTGDILTMVGSRNYFDENIDGNFNIALAERQPGSAFKPFVYAQAFREGYTPDTIVFDLKTQFSTECAPDNLSQDAPCYSPGNYDNVFKGPITLRSALAESRNVPAVKVLYLVGISDAIRLARSLGISTLDDVNRYGLTLVLGGGEVSLLDMVGAYSAFAAEGVKPETRSIVRIEDKDGNLIRDYPVSQKRILEQNVALQVSDVLSDNEARIPGFGANSPLNFPGQHVAAKTGTTNDSRDAWILGYSPNIVVGSWAGNNNNTPMVKEVAGYIVAPMWHEFFEYALSKYPNSPFPEYQETIAETDKPILRGIWEGSDIVINESGVLQITANVHSILFWVDKNNPRGARPTEPEKDSQFARWESRVRAWATQNNYVDGTLFFRQP